MCEVSYPGLPRQLAWIHDLMYTSFNYSIMKEMASVLARDIRDIPIPDYSGRYNIPISVVDMVGPSFCSPVLNLSETYDQDYQEFHDVFERIPDFGKYFWECVRDHNKFHCKKHILNIPYYLSILSLGVTTRGSTFVASHDDTRVRILVGAVMNLYMFCHPKIGTTVVADFGNVRILVKEGKEDHTFKLIVKDDDVCMSISIESRGTFAHVVMESGVTHSVLTVETNPDQTVRIIHHLWKTEYISMRSFEWIKDGEYRVSVTERYGAISVGHTDLVSKKEQMISRLQPRQAGNGLSLTSSGGGRSVTYLHERTGSTTHLKQVYSDDELVYDEKEDTLLLDKLDTNSRSRLFSTVGWKLVRNLHGEHRILKLRIPETAHIITPVDHDFVVARQKKRCNKCVVEDIQFPLRGEECSVVPEELSAVSCVYDGRMKCTYRVGEEVVPSSFCEDVNKGCAAGIHFFTDRDTVFETYLRQI